MKMLLQAVYDVVHVSRAKASVLLKWQHTTSCHL